MGQVVAIVNQKGGVAKSTTTANLAVGLATGPEQGRVLVIDCDAQGHACKALGVERDCGAGIADLVWGGVDLSEVIRPHPRIDGVSVVPGSRRMAQYDVSLAQDRGRLDVLRELAVAPVRGSYDYLLMDMPPGLGLVHLGTYMAADWIVAPVAPEEDPVDGLLDLFDSLERAREHFGAPARLLGVLVTMADLRTREHSVNIGEIRKELGGLVFQHIVRTTTRVREAARDHLTVLEYAPECTASSDYVGVTAELVARIRQEVGHAE